MDLKRIPLKRIEGCRVRLLREIQNRGGKTFPVGAVMLICEKWRGFGLQYPDGSGYVRCVSQRDFELIDAPKE